MIQFFFRGVARLVLLLTAIWTFAFVPEVLAADEAWSLIDDTGIANTDEIAFVRGDDGTLYLVWQIRPTSNKRTLCTRTISSDAETISTILPVETDWTSFTNPALRIDSQGNLQVLVSGLGGPDSGNDGAVFSFRTPLGLNTWAFEGPFSNSVNAYASEVISVVPDIAELISAWSLTGGVFYHVGETADAGDEFSADQSSCCGYFPTFGRDSVTGESYLGWYSNATGMYGQFIQKIQPTPDSSASYIVGTANEAGTAAIALDQRMAISGRSAGNAGVFVGYCVGYPTCGQVELLRIGDTEGVSVPESAGAKHVSITAAPDGKLWVMWTRDGQAHATRSNTLVTEFGPVVSVDLPGDQSPFSLTGEGSLGPLDLLSVVGLSGTAHYHYRLLPQLELAVRPKKPRRGRKVKFTVTDAGEPVEAARVSAFGRSVMTNSSGKASLRIPTTLSVGKKKAVAKHSDYKNSAAAKFTVR